MSTTATKTEKFLMPQPHIGQSVLFYPKALINSSTRTIGYVTDVNQTSIELQANGVIHEGVKNITDPQLKKNPHAKEFGCWEWCPWDVETQKRILNLEERISKLERSSK